MQQQSYNAGDIVYIFYRNPHIQDVANIQEAAVVTNPEMNWRYFFLKLTIC